ncbi:MAG: polysaccharide deacetylase family protein [Clostridia bacterium]|nr:polysaccharide deacetylase family protein [Clostridia bacterium]
MIDIKTQLCEEKFMRFPGGLTKAATFSFDDGVSADKKLIDLLKRYGLKCAFNLNSECFSGEYLNWHGRMPEEECVKTYSGAGQEIALHGARHLFLTKVPVYEATREICDNRKFLEKTFGGIVRGMAYAYGAYNDEIVAMLKFLGIAYARTTNSTHSYGVPSDWLRLDPTAHFTEPETKELTEKFLEDDPASHGKERDAWLLYIWGHAYEFDDFGLWDGAERYAKKIADTDGIWHATNIEVYDYVAAYERLVFSMDGETVFNPSARDVWLEIRGETYKIPAGVTISFG